MRRLDQAMGPGDLRNRWRDVPGQADRVFVDRLARDRSEIIPWLHRIAPLDGARVLEVGSGRGASTFALAEQGAVVTAVDLNERAMAYAEAQLATTDLTATFHLANAAHLDQVTAGPFDFVLFWASLEHMTVDERLDALRQGWALLAPGATMAIIETPNRLWPFDSHTSELAYFNWLPDEVALSYFGRSPREGLRSTYEDPAEELVAFQRLGRAMSFHELDLAIGDHGAPISCMQIERRRRNPIRRLAWTCSSSGSVERSLRRFAPTRDRAWFQPFLYLAFQKPPGVSSG